MKPLLFIDYDLNKEKDYQKLIAELIRLGSKRLLYSMWAVRLDITAQALFEHLKGFVDSDDCLIVTLVSTAFGKASFTSLTQV